LFDHRLGENLDFDADLNRCDWTSGDRIARLDGWGLTGDDLAEGGIAAPRPHTSAPVLDIQRAVSAV